MSDETPDQTRAIDVDVPTAPSSNLEPGAEPEPETKPDREAAKYRRQLRETETKAATLATRLEAMQRREVERLAGADLSTPEDLWLTGPELTELLDDDGNVDPIKVSAAVATVIETRPGWKRPDPAPAYDGGVRTPSRVDGSTWGQLLRGDPRRP